MAMEINIKINADTEGAFTDHEQTVLQALAGTASKAGTTVINAAPAAAAEAEAEATPAKVAPKPRVTRKPKPEPTRAAVLEDEEEVAGDPADDAVAEADEPEAEVAEEDEPEEETPVVKKRVAPKAAAPAGDKLTTRDAITAATPLLAQGTKGRNKVKEALAAAGDAKKVSDLKTQDEIAAFIEALEA